MEPRCSSDYNIAHFCKANYSKKTHAKGNPVLLVLVGDRLEIYPISILVGPLNIDSVHATLSKTELKPRILHLKNIGKSSISGVNCVVVSCLKEVIPPKWIDHFMDTLSFEEAECLNKLIISGMTVNCFKTEKPKPPELQGEARSLSRTRSESVDPAQRQVKSGNKLTQSSSHAVRSFSVASSGVTKKQKIIPEATEGPKLQPLPESDDRRKKKKNPNDRSTRLHSSHKPRTYNNSNNNNNINNNSNNNNNGANSLSRSSRERVVITPQSDSGVKILPHEPSSVPIVSPLSSSPVNPFMALSAPPSPFLSPTQILQSPIPNPGTLTSTSPFSPTHILQSPALNPSPIPLTSTPTSPTFPFTQQQLQQQLLLLQHQQQEIQKQQFQIQLQLQMQAQQSSSPFSNPQIYQSSSPTQYPPNPFLN